MFSIAAVSRYQPVLGAGLLLGEEVTKEQFDEAIGTGRRPAVKPHVIRRAGASVGVSRGRLLNTTS